MILIQQFINVYLVLLLCGMSKAFTQLTKAVECTYSLNLGPRDTNTYYIYNSEYPKAYRSRNYIAWCITKPSNLTIPFICEEFRILESEDCNIDSLTIYDDKGKRSYCGQKPLQVFLGPSKVTRVIFESSTYSRGGRFLCYFQVPRTENSSEMCDCGIHNTESTESVKIVGGVETGINEFPYMAGLVNVKNTSVITCGASIISRRFVLTAAHCLPYLPIEYTVVLIGDHNFKIGSDTDAAEVIIPMKYITHSKYNYKTQNQYDIALIKLKSEINYNSKVGPVCLPFESGKYDLSREEVTVAGWGITDSGRYSKYLQKANLLLLHPKDCSEHFKGSGSVLNQNTQICAYGRNSDSCQGDSGGPLLFFNPLYKSYDLVGIVSYGAECGGVGVNINVASFLPWIMQNTRGETYCNKAQ